MVPHNPEITPSRAIRLLFQAQSITSSGLGRALCCSYICQLNGPRQQECNLALAARPIDLELMQWLSAVDTEDVTEGIHQLCNDPFRRQD